MRIPAGELARSVDAAIGIANRVGYPVAMKAQAGKLAHKTEAGGVALGVADADAVRRIWAELHANVQRAQPGLKLDGVLVEAMSPPGLELVVGARRDARWGPIVILGLGGIWVEALGDVRLMAPDLTDDEIIEELGKLKTAKLLQGFRNSPPLDVKAVAAAAAALGGLMRARPDIIEIDVNPLMVHADGLGATALDALIVTGGGEPSAS
jgi:acetate---CoA ligase (ADP-forming)